MQSYPSSFAEMNWLWLVILSIKYNEQAMAFLKMAYLLQSYPSSFAEMNWLWLVILFIKYNEQAMAFLKMASQK